jgi:hypothetical protein
MTEIFEISRFSQLTDSARTTVDKTAAEYGVTVYDLAEQIAQTVRSMDVADAVKAGGWYFDAHSFAAELASKYNTTIEIAAGIISAVSPRMPWLRNKHVAESILARMGEVASLSATDAASALKLGLGANVTMAIKIARGANIAETLTGVKRRSFYNNIVAPTMNDSVTVDTWMIMAYCNITGSDKAKGLDFVRANEKALKGTGSGYILIAEAVRMVATEMSLMPHQIQAMYWVAISGSYNGGREDISK